MRIERLTIYGFGRHSNVTIEMGEGITVFYGENEAGKTTIYQFILQMLFGFPPKSNASLRYEPKSGSHYGGKIVLNDRRYGVVEVERIRGKSAGDVTVRFADGTIGGQDELNDVLRQYDRTAFESVFSFSLFQLQGLEQMDADELSRTLLSSGTTGIDLLLQLEKKLEKEKADLFKKSGKNPKMNVLLKELRELEETLKSQRMKVDEYEPAVARLEEVDRQLSGKRDELQTLQKEAERLKSAQLRLPIAANRNKLLAQIEALESTTFPPNGIRDQEMLESKKHEAEAIISRSEFQLREVNNELGNKLRKDQSEAMEALLVKEPDWQVLQQQAVSERADITRFTTEQQGLLDRLGASAPSLNKSLLEADSSVANEQRLHGLAERVQQEERKAEACRAELLRAQELERRTIQQLEQLKAEAPSEEEQAQANAWPSVRSRLAEAKAYVSLAKGEQQTIPDKAIWSLLAVTLLIIGYGLLSQQWIVAALGVILAAVSSYGLLQQKQRPGQADGRMEEMKALLKAYEGKEDAFEELCRRTEAYSRKEEQLTRMNEGNATDRQMLQSDLEHIRAEERVARKQLQEALQVCGLPSTAGVGIMAEMFRMVRALQKTDRLLRQRTADQQETSEKIAQHLEYASSILGREVPQADLYTLIRQEARQLREAALLAEAGEQQSKELAHTIRETKLELQAYEDQEQQLFAQAGVRDKQSFYEAYDRWQQLQTLKLNLAGLDEQLNALQYAEEFGEDAEQIQNRLSLTEAQRTNTEQTITELTDERASLRHKTEALLSEDAHLFTQQLYENKKAEFNARAFEWSTRQAAAEAIRQTMAELKEKKLPAVLQRANRLFHPLTNGQYAELTIQQDGHFQALRKDGQLFAIAELSQATKEQAYVALRLSLAGELTEQAPFPIIMDDPFVHFDAVRLSRMTQLISSLATDHQFIVFTCHETLVPHWPEAKIINVSEIGNSQEALEYEKIIGS